MKAILTVGVSASGKTVWAKQYAERTKAIISNRDDLRFSLTGTNGWGEYKFNKAVEGIITKLQYETIKQAAASGKDIVIADTNLNALTRSTISETCIHYGYDVEIKAFPITLEEAWKRDGLRPNGVGRDVIYKQWQQWLEFIERARYKPNESLPKAIIFDIDGTLAHMGDNRGPFEWHRVGEDVIDPIVQQMYWDFQKRGYKMVILSGRDGVCKESTYQWLIDNGITLWDQFIMRDAGDTRKDTIIKEEIFWRDVAPYYNVQVVVDDRPCVCRMWRDVGIPKIIPVADPHLEF